MSSEIRIMDAHQRAQEAIPVIHGIAAARLNRNEVDAALLIQRHFEEAAEKGLDTAQAWTDLFSAAMLALGDVLEVAAEATNAPARIVLSSLAMTHQLERG